MTRRPEDPTPDVVAEPDGLAELRERVRRIEQRLAERPPAPDTPPGDFYALEGLLARDGGEGAGAVVYAGHVETADGPVRWQYGHPVEALQSLGEVEVEQAAARLAALGSPVRLRLLLAVLQGRTTTAELSQLPDVGTSGQVYHHVRALTAAGWLRSVSRGSVQVPPERVVPAWVALSLVQ